MITSCTSQPVGDKHKFGGRSFTGPPVLPSWGTLSHLYSTIIKMHYYGPYNNLLHCKLVNFIGIPFLSLTRMGATCCNDRKTHRQGSHQESQCPMVIEPKVVFQKSTVFSFTC